MMRILSDVVLPPDFPPVEPEPYDPTKLIVTICAVAVVVATAAVLTVVLIRRRKHK